MSRFLRAQATTYAVVAFVGFSLGLLVAALFFQTRVERVEVIRPDPTPIETPDSDTKPLTLPEVTYTEVAIDTLP